MGYSRHALVGFSVQSLQKGFVFALNFGKIFILARLLSPNDFGLFSLVMIAIGITESFTQTGVNTTIVQSKKTINYFLDTAWVIAIIRGFAIGIIMIALAFTMSRFYNEDLLLPLVSVAALIPIIKGFINPAIAKWQKSFNFVREGFYHATHLAIEVFAQIILAYALHSVWALVLGVMLGAILEVFLSFLMNRERPRFSYYPSRAKTIFKNTKSLGVASLLAYLNDNADDFILGKLVGTYDLGLYHNAYSLSHKVNYELSKSAHHGLMPIFNKLDEGNDKFRLNKAFKKSLLSTLFLGLLLSAPIIIWPEQAVSLVLGEKWSEAAIVLPILALAGIIHGIANVSYAFLIAKKQYFFMNLHLFVSLSLMIVGIIVFSRNSALLGACRAIALSRLISLPIVLFGVKRGFKRA